MIEAMPFLPGLSPVQRKSLTASQDAGNLTSNGGLIVLREVANLWTVIASLSQSPKLHLAGNVVPARVEIEHDGSAIARYHVAPAAAEVVAETKPAPKRAGAKLS